MLAQFSRSGLIQDVANRLIAAFVENLQVRLSDQEGNVAQTAKEFDAGHAMISIMLNSFKGAIRRIFRRGA